MKPLCTFTRIAEFQNALPPRDPVTLRFTPEQETGIPFALLEFVDGQGIIVEATPGSEAQPKQWTVSRTELDGALTVFQKSPMITVADHHGALVLVAGTKSVMLSHFSSEPQVTPLNPAIRSLNSRPPVSAPAAPVNRPPVSPAPVAQPPLMADARTQTQAYRILEAALRLSAASNGAPILEPAPQGYHIMISDVMGYEFDTSQPDVIVITLIAGDTRKKTRYPALTDLESNALLQLFKTLGTATPHHPPNSRR